MTLTYNVDIQKHLHYIIFKEMNEIRSWNLSGNDLKIFAAFYNKDFELLHTIPEYESRMLILFSKEIKDALMTELNVSYNTFNNSLSKLRKKGLIKGNFLIEKLLFDLNSTEFSIIIKLKHAPEFSKVITEAQKVIQG